MKEEELKLITNGYFTKDNYEIVFDRNQNFYYHCYLINNNKKDFVNYQLIKLKNSESPAQVYYLNYKFGKINSKGLDSSKVRFLAILQETF